MSGTDVSRATFCSGSGSAPQGLVDLGKPLKPVLFRYGLPPTTEFRNQLRVS